MSEAIAPLNPRQALFVEQYLIDLNGKEAAIRAGYTPEAASVRAAKLLRRSSIRHAVATAMAARAARSHGFFEGGITAERVIAEYGRIAFSDRRRFAAWGASAGPNHLRFAATRALSADDRAAVAEVVAGKNGVRRVRLFDKQAALNSLSRIFAYADRARFRVVEAAAAKPAAPPPVSAAGHALSERQRRFADEFLQDFAVGAAARRAGYAAKSAAQLATKLQRYPQVAARIAAGIAKQHRAIRIEADRVIAEYARIAFADITRIADWTHQRVKLKAAATRRARRQRRDSGTQPAAWCNPAGHAAR